MVTKGEGRCSVQSLSRPSLRPHGLRHPRPPCPSPTPAVYSDSCPLSRWCHPTISSSVVPFSSRRQSFPGRRETAKWVTEVNQVDGWLQNYWWWAYYSVYRSSNIRYTWNNVINQRWGEVLAAQSCPTLCNPMNCSPPGSSVHRALQARILEWVAMSSRGSSRPRDQTWVSCTAGSLFTIWATREAGVTSRKNKS